MADLPEYTQQTQVQMQTSPDWGNETRNYAAATNYLSSIGATIAQTASTKLAQDMGTRAGETPSGDLLPSITDADKVYANSYITQANATLSLQGSKLLSDAQIEMARSARLTSAMIAENQRSVGMSLQKLVDLAPSEVRPGLKNQFASMMIGNHHDLQTKMISQQREDQRDLILSSTNQNAETAFNLAMAGETEAAEALAKSTKATGKAGVDANLISRVQADQGAETVLKSAQSGKYIGMALAARREGKLEGFYRDFATNKPEDLTYQQWQHVGNSVSSYIGGLENLRRQDETLRLANFAVDLARNPNVSPDKIVELQENVSPLGFAQAQLSMIKAQQRVKAEKVETDIGVDTFADVTAFSAFSSKQKNAAFDRLTNAAMQQAASRGEVLTVQEAQRNTVIGAGGTVPKYVDQLNGQLGTANPALLNPAIASIDFINASGKGQNIAGLSDDALSMAQMYKSLRNTYPEAEAAQKAHEIVYSKSAEQRTANNEAWASYVQDQKDKGETNSSFAIRMADVPVGTAINPNLMGDKIYSQFQSFFKATNGDTQAALKMTKQYVTDNYGISNVNGRKEYQYMPIEKALELPENSAGVIQADLAQEVSKQFASTNELYKQGRVDWYWEVKPSIELQDAQLAARKYNALEDEFSRNPVSGKMLDLQGKRKEKNEAEKRIKEFNAGSPPKVIQHFRDGSTKEFSLVIQANDSTRHAANGGLVGSWDVALRSGSGFMSIASADPTASNVIYRPNANKIRMDYLSINMLPATHETGPAGTHSNLSFPLTDERFIKSLFKNKG